MKSSKSLLTTALALLTLISTAAAEVEAIGVNVPFEFSVGDQRMPAGEYRIAISRDFILHLVRTDRSRLSTGLTIHVGDGSRVDEIPRVIFHCYANKCFLSQVWMGDVRVGHQLYASTAELESARNVKQEQMVTVATRSAN